MKITIDRSAFLRPLGHVQSVVERRNTIPILANVLLKARNGRVQLTATDMDINYPHTPSSSNEYNTGLVVMVSSPHTLQLMVEWETKIKQ